jgi:hypothetical protein
MVTGRNTIWRQNLQNIQFDIPVSLRSENKTNKQTNKQTPWPLVRERIIPTDRPPLVDEI